MWRQIVDTDDLHRMEPLPQVLINEAAEILSPAWAAQKIHDLEIGARVQMVRYGVPPGLRDSSGTFGRAEYVRQKAIEENPLDPRTNWLKRNTWWQEIRRAGKRLGLETFD